MDLLGTRAGKLAIVEVKTGKKIQASVRLQVAAQVMTQEDNPDGHVWRQGAEIGAYALQLGEDGTYKLLDYDVGRDIRSIVLAAAQVAQWRLRNDPKAQLSGGGAHALYREDGVRVPGIGTVLKLAGMVDLSGIPAGILETARAKGEAVHTCLQYLVEEDLDAASIPEHLRGYIAAYWSFCQREHFVATATEESAVYDCSRTMGSL